MKRIALALLLLITPAWALAGPWPTDDVTTTHLDSATDDPSQARPEIYNAMLRVKDIIAARASASGIASLDSGSKVPIAQIPTGSGGVQAYDSDLNCVAGLSSTGLVARTGTGTCAVRTLGVGTGMTISNATGVSGDPSIALSSNLQSWSGKTAPSGTVVGTTDSQTLTNKTLTAPVLSGTVTGTYTLAGTPTFPATVVSTTGTQTLTNKTLTAPVLSGTVTGTYTLAGTPTFPATVVSTTGTQTLTNKTLTTPAISGAPSFTAPVSTKEALGIYAGTVTSSGTVVALPTGWSSSRTGTGQYTVTHNLGAASYVVVATVEYTITDGGERIITVQRSTNSFTLGVYGGDGNFRDHAFSFIVYDY